MTNRENFGSRAAVIMAMAGSAIGLGNIWRFPFIVGEYGGAAFILVYIVCCFLLSLPILLSESIIGRRTHQNTFGAMSTLAPGTHWKWLGLLTIVSPLIILSYYSVVGGWSFAYLIKACALQFKPENVEEVTGMFAAFSSSVWGPLACLLVFLGLTALIIFSGVKKGIEKFSKISMPVLFVLIVVIAVYSVTLPGAMDGVRYLVKPDFSKLSSDAFSAALGQSFFSLSLGVGTMLIYSSYVSKDENILVSGTGTALFDMLFAILAGFAVMPAVFAAGIAPSSGPGLVFETLPYIFAKMGAGGQFLSAAVAILFFLTILVAALTSSISMMEVGVAYMVEEKGVSRTKATAGIFFLTLVLGILCSLSFGTLSGVKLLGNTIFNFCDRLCSNWLMTLGALMFSIFVGWKMDKAAVRDELTNGGTLKANSRMFPFIYFLIKYIAPLTIAAIFISGLLA
ncbi:MAG: sodium-dependent transporter [Bacteroidales bacterium]|nr:sodium-dependent transporter [Bacteroidales bacterium]